MQAVQRDSISAPRAPTGNHFMNLCHEETLDYMDGTVASGDALCTLIPGEDCSMSAAVLPTEAQSFSSTTSQNQRLDCESTYRKQSISNMYIPNNSQPSRKRKSSEVLRFLAELTSGELKALIFAFEVTERRKRKAAQVNLLSGEVNVPQQNPTIMPSYQFTAHNALSQDASIIPERSADLVNGYVEILDSCPPPVLPRLQKDKGAEWKGHGSQISCVNHMSLNSNPTNYSNFKNLSNTTSVSDRCTQRRNMGDNSVFPRPGTQQALEPHVVNHQHCHSLTEQTSPSLQAHKEKTSVCHLGVGTSYSHAHCRALGAECNIQDYSFNCFNSSSTSLSTLASVPVNPNYLGSSQQNGGYNHSVQSLDAINSPDTNQTNSPDPKTSTSQHDEQSLKEIKALYDMLRTSYGNKMNDDSKRQKLEGCSTRVQPVPSELGQMNNTSISATQSTHDNHASQMIGCQDVWCPNAGFLSSSQNTTIGQQVAEFVRNEYLPLIESNVSNSSNPSHSRAQENQNAETSPSFEIFGNVKDAVPLTQSEGMTEGSLIHPLPADSMDQVNCAAFTRATRSLTTKLAEVLKPSSCSNEGSGNLRPPNNMDDLSPSQSVPVEQFTEGCLISKCCATSGGFQRNLTQILRSEDISRMQKAAANVGAHLSNAESNDQESAVPVPLSQGFPEQYIAFPAAASNLSGAPSNLVDPSVHNQGQARLHCKTSSGVSAGIHIENKSLPSDVYPTNDSEINNVSTEKVVEELNSIPNSEDLLAKESDTLEFILRSLGIVPEDNEGENAANLTSLSSSGVTSPEQSRTVGLPVDPSCTDVKQNLTLPSFNMVISSGEQQVAASLNPHSTGSMVTRDWSDVAFSPGDIGKVSTAVTPLEDGKTTSAVSKLKPDGVNHWISVCQPNCHVQSGQNPVVTTARSGAEDNFPSQETELPNVVVSSVGGSVPVSVGGSQQLEEKLPDNLACPQIARQHTVTNSIQLEDEKLNRIASCKENDPSIGPIIPSKLSRLVSSVSHTASALLVEPSLIVQKTLPPSSAYGGHQQNSLFSSLSSSSCVQLAQSTRLINTAANPCSVGMSGNENRYQLRNYSSTSSPTEEPEVTVCSGINVSNLSLVGYKQPVADGLYDSHTALRKQLNTVLQEDIKNRTFETMGIPLSMTHGSRESLMLSSEESFEKPMDMTQAANVNSLAGIENSSATGASSSANTCDSLRAMRDVLFSRVRRLKCARAALGIRSFPQSSNGEVNAASLTVGQASLVQNETLEGCTAVAASNHTDKDLLSRIRITFVFSLSEHWKFINSTNFISNSLVSAGQQLLRSSEKVRSFSTKQVERHPNEVNGPFIAVMGAVSNSEGNTQRHLTDLPHSQSVVPFTSDSSTQRTDTSIFSAVADHPESVSHPEVGSHKNHASVDHAGETNALDSTNISKLLPGNGQCIKIPPEANNTRVQREASALCLSSKEMMALNFFSQNKFRSASELEMTTESILRFWSPFGEATESHHPNHEMEKGLAFDQCIEWLHSGLGLCTVASAAELNSNMHKLNAMHCLHFGFTATVDRRQLYGEKSHPKELCNGGSGTEVIVFEDYKPELLESTSRSHLLTDEGRMDNWADTALSNVLLDTYEPKPCLQNSSSQITQVYGDEQFEAGKAEIAGTVMRMNSRGNKSINSNDERELLSQDQRYPEALTQPSSGQESWNECEPNMDVSSEIKIKVLEHQELKNVLLELSNIIPKTLILSPESKVAETSEVGNPGAHWKLSRNWDHSHLDVAQEQMETTATECCSDALNFTSLSLGRVGNSLPH
ncbi:uncharacterized protein LOC144696776 [Cetorhinus maximus]